MAVNMYCCEYSHIFALKLPKTRDNNNVKRCQALITNCPPQAYHGNPIASTISALRDGPKSGIEAK